MQLLFGHLTTMQSDIYQLEAVQRRAVRFVINCYDRYQSVSHMLMTIMLYKIIHNLVRIQLDLPFTYSNQINYTRGHLMKIQQPATRVDSLSFLQQLSCGTLYREILLIPAHLVILNEN